MNKFNLTLGCLLVFCFMQLQAKITLPAYFSSNMVLQQNAEIKMQGKANVGTQIMLACSWDKKVYAEWTDKAGNFTIKIKTPSFGGPYTMVLSGEGTAIKFDNVLLGDVWLCSGQSNMEMPLSGWGKINNYQKEIEAANYPKIRLLQVKHTTSNTPLTDASIENGGWAVCTPASIPEFSSTAYFFAREIFQKTGIPIGLIHSSWGGTIAEAWTSPGTISSIPDFKESLAKVQQTVKEDAYPAEVAQWQKILDQKDQGFNVGSAIWAASKLTDNDWPEMQLPAFFDLKEKPNFDGVVWFRKKITIPKAWAGKPLKISLGTIDDNDITFFDGEEIGRTQGYDQTRNYTLAADKVTAGVHTLTVRVFDGGGGGGIYGDGASFFLQSGSDKQPLQGAWKYKIGVNMKDLKPMPQPNNGPNRPTVLYNAMINPFISFPIRGVIWYQGESNAGRWKQYQTLFPALINDWRQKWLHPDLPFYFVQLASYGRGEGDDFSWPLLREAQLKALKLPNTGMAVAIDIGDEQDIHPKNKQDVGKRLALIALAKSYARQIEYSGPMYKEMVVQGNEIKINFDLNKDLKAKESPLLGFSIAGEDRVFHPAEAVIKSGAVYVKSSAVAKPIAVRYAWANAPQANLTNASGLPASPFRTDSWLK